MFLRSCTQSRIALLVISVLLIHEFAEAQFIHKNTYGADSQGIIQFDTPSDLAIHTSGDIYVLDHERIWRLGTDGSLVSFFVIAQGGNDFTYGTGLALDEAGALWVCTSRNEILKFNADGNVVFSFGSMGSGDGQFDQPSALDFGSDGRLYVLDANNYRVQIFDDLGNFISKFGEQGDEFFHFKSMPTKMAVGGQFDDVFITFSSENQFMVFSNTGGLRARLGLEGDQPGQFKGPQGIDVDANEFVYIVDLNNQRIQIWDNLLQFDRSFGTQGDANGEFLSPYALALDAVGNVFISDYPTIPRIQKFSSSDQFLLSVGEIDQPGQFNGPWGITASPEDEINVLDRDNKRMQKMDLAGNIITATPLDIGAAATSITSDFFGTLYLNDLSNNRILILDNDGNLIREFSKHPDSVGGFSSPTAVAVSKGLDRNLYVADGNVGEVLMFGPDSSLVRVIGAGRLNSVKDMDLDLSNNLYVINATGIFDGEVVVFDEDGTELGFFGQDLLEGPIGLHVDPWGNVFVTENSPEGNVINVFDSNWDFLTDFGPNGFADSEFDQVANDITVAVDYTYWITDSRANNVKIYQGVPVISLMKGSELVDSLSFGKIDVLRDTSMAVTLKNSGAAPLLFDQDLIASFSSGNVDDFHIDTLLLSEGLGPFQGLGFTVSFEPLTSGAKSAILQIESNDAAVPVFNLTVTGEADKLDQSIDFPAVPSKTEEDPPFRLEATATSQLQVTYESSNPAVAMISGDTVTIMGPGTADLTAFQEGSAIYNAAEPVTHPFLVEEVTGANYPSDLNVTIFPNPSYRVLNVHSLKPLQQVSLYTSSGAKIYDRVADHASELQLSLMPSLDSIFLLEITFSDGQVIRRRILVFH